MKKISAGKIVAVIGIAAVLIALCGVATLWIMFPPEKIKGIVVTEAQKALGRKVEIQKASISIYPYLGVNMTGVSIANTSRDGYSTEPFVKLERLSAKISLMSIFKGYPEITKILLKKPQICVEVDPAGSFNYDDMAVMKSDTTVKQEKKKSALPVLPVPVTLKSFTIENGSVVYINKKDGQEIRIGNINQTIKLSIDRQLKDIRTTGALVLSQVSVKTKEITKPLSNLNITLSHDINANLVDGKAQIKELKLSFQKLFFNMSGSVNGLNDTPNLDLSINADAISIQDLLSEIPVELAPDVAKLKADGTARLSLSLKGAVSDSNFPIQGNLKLDNTTIRYTSLPKSINGLNADMAFTGNSLDVKDLRMKFGDSPVNLKATVNNFKKPFINLALNANINLDDMKNVIELPKGASLSGQLVTDITAKGEADPANPTKLDVKGKLDLGNVAVLWPPLAKPAVINGTFTLSSKAIGQNLSVVIGKSSLTMNAAISNYLSIVFADSTKKLPRPSVDFKITSPYLNVDEIMPPEQKSADNSAAKNNTSAKSSQPQADVPLIAPLPGVDMKGNISANKIIYNGVEMNNLNMNVNVLNDIADVDIRTGFSDGTINNNIHADMRNTNNVAFTNKLNISNIEINYLLLKFGGFLKPDNPLNRQIINLENSLFGKVNLKSEISGNGGTSDQISKSLRGQVDANVTNGRISNSLVLKNISGVISKFVKVDDITFRDLSALLTIANEKVNFKNLKMLSDVGDWDAGGNLGFDNSLAMNISNRLPKNISEKILGAQNSGKNALKGLLQGTQLSQFAGAIDNVGIPSDKEGRVTLKMALNGTTTKPSASFVGFGEGTSNQAQSSQQKSVKEQVTQQLKQELTEKKQEVQQKLQAEGAKAEEQAKEKVQEQKTNIDNQLKQNENQLKSKLKKLF
jgi:uncharacterized protein involved in outer membrane biogenesis